MLLALWSVLDIYLVSQDVDVVSEGQRQRLCENDSSTVVGRFCME